MQRIVYAENESNYCARCQTGGKLLADRALSQLLKKDWPRTLEELEARMRDGVGAALSTASAGWPALRTRTSHCGPHMRIRLVALDLDGTLLDPRGQLTTTCARPWRRHAARDAAARRALHRAPLPHARCRYAQALGLTGAIVVHNGALVKDIASGETLQHAYLPPELDPRRARARALGTGRRSSTSTAITTVDGPPDRARRRARTRSSASTSTTTASYARVVDDVAAARRSRRDHGQHDGEDEDALGAAARARAGALRRPASQTHSLINKNYQGQILEFLSPRSGKWPALAAARGVGGHRAARDRRGRRRHRTTSR